jgi:hypothetical protein
VCEGLLDWIQKSDLKREQLIAINACETTTEDADAVLILTYKSA